VRADRFLWSVDADRIDLEFPQTSDRVAVRARAWRCAEEAPKPFELCLELSRDGRALRLYSRDDWRIRPDGEALELDGDAPPAGALLEAAGPRGIDEPIAPARAHAPAGEAAGALFD
jgi:hypothetical protein